MNVVITGANRGIGLALVKAYLLRSHHVYALCRRASPELSATGATIIEGVDVSDFDSLDAALAPLKGVSIDLLINNAGILRRESINDKAPETIVEQFKVNSLAPLLVTQCLLNQLSGDAKVAFITSRMGSMADNGSGGYYGYRMSKAALNAAAVSLAQDLKNEGIAVGILHPGFVQTDMVNGNGDITAEECADRLLLRIEELTLSTSGQFVHSNGDILPW